ncbi:MAG TPA: transglutaminase family protein [Candidatus Acidoferrales bacterium]|jgi:transglutaminase-like putative cysteine protease|nr:transglutaminase family protein [Candidatus Acidoferrales bacterium]
MNYAITHRTTYEYAAPVAVSHHVARLEPRQTAAQTPENFGLRILPQPVLRKARADYFGNQLCFFSVQETHRRLDIIASSRVQVRPHEPGPPENSPAWEEVAGLFRDPVAPEVIPPYQFVFDSPHVRASLNLADYARESFAKGRPLLEGALDLTRRIFKDFKYDSKATTIVTPLEEVLEKRRGVCQDFAHLSIACLRSLGLPARYVSGYLRTRPPEGKEKLVGADASHAWFSIFCPRNGWKDFDPTNNLQVSQEHITVAFGRDFSDVSPVAGILTGGGQHEVKVSVDVQELDG